MDRLKKRNADRQKELADHTSKKSEAVDEETAKRERIQKGMAALNMSGTGDDDDKVAKRKNIYKEIADQLKGTSDDLL